MFLVLYSLKEKTLGIGSRVMTVVSKHFLPLANFYVGE